MVVDAHEKIQEFRLKLRRSERFFFREKQTICNEMNSSGSFNYQIVQFYQRSFVEIFTTAEQFHLFHF